MLRTLYLAAGVELGVLQGGVRLAGMRSERWRRSGSRYPWVWVVGRVVLLAAASLVVAVPAVAQDNQTCLMCHNNPAMFEGRSDAQRLVVRPDVFGASVHGSAGMQ